MWLTSSGGWHTYCFRRTRCIGLLASLLSLRGLAIVQSSLKLADRYWQYFKLLFSFRYEVQAIYISSSNVLGALLLALFCEVTLHIQESTNSAPSTMTFQLIPTFNLHPHFPSLRLILNLALPMATIAQIFLERVLEKQDYLHRSRRLESQSHPLSSFQVNSPL